MLQVNSYGFESLPFYDDAQFSIGRALGERNKRRAFRQSLAAWLITASFALQAVSLLFN